MLDDCAGDWRCARWNVLKYTPNYAVDPARYPARVQVVTASSFIHGCRSAVHRCKCWSDRGRLYGGQVRSFGSSALRAPIGASPDQK